MHLRKATLAVCVFRQCCAAHAYEEARFAVAADMPEVAIAWQEDAAREYAKASAHLDFLLGVGAVVTLARIDRDNSAVFHRGELDATDAAPFEHEAPECPWVFDTDDEGQAYFTTEEKACARQREYRIARGFDPITGEKANPRPPCLL